MMTYEYKQEPVSTYRVAERLNALQVEGWEFVQILDQKPAPVYRNGGALGPGTTVLLLRKQT